MASAPPNTGNDDRNRKAEETAALLLLLGRKRYDLPALIRAAKIRPRPFRRIVPSGILATDLAQPYLAITTAWTAERAALIEAYQAALRLGDHSIFTRQLEQSAARVGQVVAVANHRLPDALQSIERWHRKQWIGRIKAATTLDVSTLTAANDVAPEVANASTWNQQLADDVHQQVKQRIGSAMVAGLAGATPATAAGVLIADAVAKARKRARNIAVDQVGRLSTDLSRARRQAAGIGSFIWRHSPHVVHPRPEHVARDGRTYTQRNAPNDRAGTLYGCQCWEEPTFG